MTNSEIDILTALMGARMGNVTRQPIAAFMATGKRDLDAARRMEAAGLVILTPTKWPGCFKVTRAVEPHA